MQHFNKDFCQFFIDLAPNNHKDWFDENRNRYEQNIREPFKKFVQHIISEISKLDNSFKDLEAKDCIFRINRDIRFSKDKTPYKMMVSAVVSPNGKKDRAINGVYFELGPEFVSIYAGVYETEKENTLRIRNKIADNLKEFDKLINDKDFTKTFGEILGDKNKIIPKELKAAAEKQPLIFNKNWYFRTQFPASLITESKLSDTIIKAYKTSKPIQEFFNEAIK